MHPVVKRMCFFLRTARPRRGFSLTELLVVIGIIALLMGVLLTAMSKVRTQALRTQTVATMEGFSKACEAFQLEHGFYPGVIPEAVLAGGGSAGLSQRPFTATENALLHLLGGYRVFHPELAPDPTGEYANFGVCDEPRIKCLTFGNSEWELKVDLRRIGEGPVIDGKAYAPYFTPGGNELVVVKGQLNEDGAPECCDHPHQFEACPDPCLPDLVDGW